MDLYKFESNMKIFNDKFSYLSELFKLNYPLPKYSDFTPTERIQYDDFIHILSMAEEMISLSFPRVHDHSGLNISVRYKDIYIFHVIGKEKKFNFELGRALDEMIDAWRKWSQY